MPKSALWLAVAIINKSQITVFGTISAIHSWSLEMGAFICCGERDIGPAFSKL